MSVLYRFNIASSSRGYADLALLLISGTSEIRCKGITKMREHQKSVLANVITIAKLTNRNLRTRINP